MARPMRIEFAGAWYWISNRSLPGRHVFRSDWDYPLFQELLEEIQERFQVNLHAYCLLKDEYHLLVNTRHANLAEAMRHLQSSYTQRWNRDWNSEGPIFRGRYHSTLFQADTYLLPLSAMVHSQAQRAEQFVSIDTYSWSSAGAYYAALGGARTDDSFLCMDAIRNRLPDDCMSYKKYCESSRWHSLSQRLMSKKKPAILGDAEYMQKLAGIAKGEYQATLAQSQHEAPACLERVLNSVSSVMKVHRRALYEGRRGQLNIPRMMAIYLSHRRARLSLNELADHFGMNHYSSASSAMQRYQKLRASQQDILHLESEVLRCLSLS